MKIPLLLSLRTPLQAGVVGAFILGGATSSLARVNFDGVFAPESGQVASVEKNHRAELSLNGLWRFEPVSLPANFREGYDTTPELPAASADGWSSTSIRIPSPWNVNSFANNKGLGGDFRTYPSYPASWNDIKMGWLQRSFAVPDSWKDRRVRLHFEALAGDSVIYINGREVGHHFGIFLPFELDVTDALRFGQANEILIGVRKASLFDDRRTDYGRRTYQAGSFWGQHVVGIWQDVSLLAVAPLHVSDTYIRPDLKADRLSIDVTLRNDTDRDLTATVSADARAWIRHAAPFDQASIIPSDQIASTSSLDLAPKTVTIPAHGQAVVTLSAPVNGKLKTWSPAAPNLYGLVVSTSVGNQEVDTDYTRFGWRQIELRGSHVFLNGQRIILKGDSWHFMGIPQMTRRYAWAWYKAAHDANLNAVRLHAEPFPRFYLDMADEMGFLVLDETAVWASDGGPKLGAEAFWKDTERHLSELVLRDRDHPSIFGWSVSNEVRPIVKGVMRNPPGMMDKLDGYYATWRDICQKLDPSRPWVSADGEDDGAGHLPTYVVHYGGTDSMDRGSKSGLPWGVGEAGNAYYGTPEQVAIAAGTGDRAYESVLGRMEGVAIGSRDSLYQQTLRDASYRSVFNLVWYGLQPLAFGMADTSKAPSLDDGVYFTRFEEGVPGVQPERLGPYSSTLNPGYDPSLPLYKPWPLFDAIRDASAEPPVPGKWFKELPPKAQPAPKLPAPAPVDAIRMLAGDHGLLARDLRRTGIPSSIFKKGETGNVSVLFIDGETPPDAATAKPEIDRVLRSGGTVLVWGAAPATLAKLDALLPAPIELTQRTSSSLLPSRDQDAGTWADPIINGLTAADLYFSELSPSEIITHGLAGPLVEQSTVLIKAPAVDWLLWNKQPEYAKTGMIIRSERETKPSGVAMISKRIGSGRLVVTTLPAAPRLAKAEKAVRAILNNLGIPLEQGSASRAIGRNGNVIRALVLGSFPAATMDDAVAHKGIDFSQAASFRDGTKIDRIPWRLEESESGLFELDKMGFNPKRNAVAYLSFWVSSPRSLDDLLIEPDMPVIGLEFEADDAIQVWLNGNLVAQKIRTAPLSGGKVTANGLKLHQGWNHFLVKVINRDGTWQFSGRLTCSQPDFLADLVSAPEKP